MAPFYLLHRCCKSFLFFQRRSFGSTSAVSPLSQWLWKKNRCPEGRGCRGLNTGSDPSWSPRWVYNAPHRPRAWRDTRGFAPRITTTQDFCKLQGKIEGEDFKKLFFSDGCHCSISSLMRVLFTMSCGWKSQSRHPPSDVSLYSLKKQNNSFPSLMS